MKTCSASSLISLFFLILFQVSAAGQVEPEKPGNGPCDMVIHNHALGTLYYAPVSGESPPFDEINIRYLIHEQTNILEENLGMGIVARQCCPDEPDCLLPSCPCLSFTSACDAAPVFVFLVPQGMNIAFESEGPQGGKIALWIRKVNIHKMIFRICVLDPADLPSPNEHTHFMEFTINSRLRSRIGGKRKYRFKTTYIEGVLKLESEVL